MLHIILQVKILELGLKSVIVTKEALVLHTLPLRTICDTISTRQ